MDKQRSPKFSFSRQPIQSAEQQQALQQLKNKFKGQMQLVINKSETLDQKQLVANFLNRLNITILPEDENNIFFDLKQYSEMYIEKEILGEGCIGLVKTVIRKSDNQQFAVKIVKTDDEEIVKNMILEFKNLRKLSHPNIVQMEQLFVQWNEGFQATGTVCVIMEKVNGREMFEVIQQDKQYTEKTTRILFKQVLSAIQYLHDNYVCHRDLKPNNILCSEDGQNIKITDFNVSKFSDSYKEFGNLNEHGKIEMWTYTGTVAFSAPEIFSGGLYNEQVDMWSAGVILYVMLSGELPFNAEYLNDLIEQIQQCKYEMDSKIWQQISPAAKNLIQNLLQKDPQKRLTPEQALEHTWIIKECSDKALPRESLVKNIDRLLNVRPKKLGEKREQKLRQLCFLFGVGDIWRRHSQGYPSKTSIQEDFRKFKSIDVSSYSDETDTVKVTKDQTKTGVYNISYDFDDSD
ncbi:hypothetical protein pb186bvf_001355 [Paramecium bursaria]